MKKILNFAMYNDYFHIVLGYIFILTVLIIIGAMMQIETSRIAKEYENEKNSRTNTICQAKSD